MARLKLAPGRSNVLVVTFSDYMMEGGGTNKVVLDQANLMIERGINVIVLVPYKVSRFFREYDGHWIVYANNAFAGIGATPELSRQIARNRESLSACYLQHSLGVDLDDVSKLLDAWAGEVRYYIHDFTSQCVSPQMIRPGGAYCGLTHAGPDCGDCPLRKDGERVFEGYSKFFEHLGPRLTPIAPSESAARIWAAAHGRLCAANVRVLPHLIQVGIRSPEVPRSGKLRVGLVGQDSHIKGSILWDTLAMADFASGYEIFHFGKTVRQRPGVVEVAVDFHAGDRAMVDKLGEYGIDVAILYSECPESFSYAYFECLQAGAYVVTGPKSGNIRAQVELCGNGEVFGSHQAVFDAMADVEGFTRRVREWQAAQVSVPVFGTSDAFLDGVYLNNDNGRQMNMRLFSPIRSILYHRACWKHQKSLEKI